MRANLSQVIFCGDICEEILGRRGQIRIQESRSPTGLWCFTLFMLISI